MYIKIGGRRNGKSYQLLCEQISELELRIEFAKKFNLPYKEDEQCLKSLLQKLDGSEYHRKKNNKKTKNS